MERCAAARTPVAEGRRPESGTFDRTNYFIPDCASLHPGYDREGENAMAATPPPVELGTPAPDFLLPATDGRTYEFADVAGRNGTVIVLSLCQSGGQPYGRGSAVGA